MQDWRGISKEKWMQRAEAAERELAALKAVLSEIVGPDFYWQSKWGRRPGCESRNHKQCRGALWQCAACERWFCYEEGADDAHPGVCDDCAAKAVGPSRIHRLKLGDTLTIAVTAGERIVASVHFSLTALDGWGALVEIQTNTVPHGDSSTYPK